MSVADPSFDFASTHPLVVNHNAYGHFELDMSARLWLFTSSVPATHYAGLV